eukprot:62709-Hanusia_phi.AAC.1
MLPCAIRPTRLYSAPGEQSAQIDSRQDSVPTSVTPNPWPHSMTPRVGRGPSTPHGRRKSPGPSR